MEPIKITEPGFRVRRGISADVERLVNLHYRVFDTNTHHLLLLGRPVLASAYHWYCESPNAFTLVAENHGGTIGCATVSVGSYYAFFRQHWLRVVAAFLRKPNRLFHPLLLQRLSGVFSPSRPASRKIHTNRSAYLGYLVVDAEQRGKGVGGALIRASVENCRSRGWEQLVTCLHRPNVSAFSFYQRLGFQRFPELDAGDLLGIRIQTVKIALERNASEALGVNGTVAI